MRWRNTTHRYGAIAQSLHWLIAVAIVIQLGLGFQGAALAPGIDQLIVLARHKSVGITIAALAVVRLAWRASNPPVMLPPDLHRSLRRAAHINHALLYLLLFALPLTGWLFSSASGISVSWFSTIVLPDLVAADKSLARTLRLIHQTLAITLLLTLALHVAAVLWHQLIRRDGVLATMLPTRGKDRR